MKKCILIDKGDSLIDLSMETLLSDGEDLSLSLVIFPGRRPGHFLRRALAESLKKPYAAPQIFSMDDWVDKTNEKLGYYNRSLNQIDGVALLYELHKTKGMPGAPSKTIPLDAFMPWAYKLYSDFEELAIEGVKPETLKSIQAAAEENLPPRIQEVLSDLAGLYQDFYLKLEEEGFSTRSMRYQRVSEDCERLGLSSYQRILLVGFLGLTNAEVKIFGKLLHYDNASILLQNGPEIEKIIKRLDLKPERLPVAKQGPRIQYYKALDAHGQVMKLNQVIAQSADHGSRVVVLPASDTLFPVVQHTLPLLDDDWNISMGYPLFRTQVYSFLVILGRSIESRDEGHYFVPDYLRLVLHPFIKNLFMDGASYPTRVLFHTIEEVLNQKQVRFVSLEEIENDTQIIQESLARLSGLEVKGISDKRIFEQLTRIHGILLRPFENITNIGNFCQHLLELISHISLNSSVNHHPYTSSFIESLIGGLNELLLSDIARESFTDIKSYFLMLESYVKTINVPFPGTPLKGLQVLGFLETRNLCFDAVYFLDTNEGVIPASKKEDTLFPMVVRKELGLSTYRQREKIAQYYFENLIAGAKEVHIFYREGEGQVRSRLVERMIWEEQKETGSLDLKNQEVIFFQSKFSQKAPEPVKKNHDILAKLSDLVFSASMLDTYLSCPLRFYYRYILKLEEKDELGEKLEQADIGSLVHEILKEFFVTKKNGSLEISNTDYEAIITVSDRIFEEKYGQHLDGRMYLIRSQLQTRLRDILDNHRRKYQGVVIMGCERKYSSRIEIPNVGMVKIRGWLDRIDKKGNETIILDYKTGLNPVRPSHKNFSLEERDKWHKTLRSVQLPFYILLYLQSHPENEVSTLNAGLILLGSKIIDEKFLFDNGDDREFLYGQYRQAIYSLIAEILNPKMEFGDTPDPRVECAHCEYKVLCGRQWVKSRW